jgi:ABC-type transport system involved in cytochrome bd biosynthesis fused ATPase/permease subunit
MSKKYKLIVGLLIIAILVGLVAWASGLVLLYMLAILFLYVSIGVLAFGTKKAGYAELLLEGLFWNIL